MDGGIIVAVLVGIVILLLLFDTFARVVYYQSWYEVFDERRLDDYRSPPGAASSGDSNEPVSRPQAAE